jgi:hypothetical protein
MPSDTEIEKYRYDFEIVRLTAEQVIKDFGIHAIDITFSGNPLSAYDELRNQLIPILRSLAGEDQTKLASLMYRIDIEEGQIKSLPSGKERFEKLAEIILQREFKKVLIRKFFSDNGPR